MIRVEICNIYDGEITEFKYKKGDIIPDILRTGIQDEMALFIDPSTTSLGMSLAILKHKAPVYGIGFRRGSENTKEDFVDEFGILLDFILKNNKVTFMMVENQYMDRRRIEAYAALKLIMSKIKYIATLNRIKVELIVPPVWKGPVLDLYPGNVDKRKSNKQEVRAVMTKIIPRTMSITTTDIFDSLGIMYYYFTKVYLGNSKGRPDLPVMIKNIAEGIDIKEYERLARGIDPNKLNSEVKAFNEYFFEECGGEIVNITTGNEKEFRKTINVTMKRISQQPNESFVGMLKRELEIIKLRNVREFDFVVFDPEMGVEDNAKAYIKTRDYKTGIMLFKPYRKSYQEIYQGRELLGKITESDYILVQIHR